MKAPLYSLLNLAEAEGSQEELYSINRGNKEERSKNDWVAHTKSVVVDGNQYASEAEYEGKEAYQKVQISAKKRNFL